eukprot:5984420-Prymnesium_polylepis.1
MQYITDQRQAKIPMNGWEKTIDTFEFLTCDVEYEWVATASGAPPQGVVFGTEPSQSNPRLVICATDNDEHDIGKYIVEQGTKTAQRSRDVCCPTSLPVPPPHLRTAVRRRR